MVTFITGNQHKADRLAAYLGHPIAHQKVDLDEIQSLDLHAIVRHKVHEAYRQAKKPVLVEDISLEIAALGKLPGPFVKWFLQELTAEQLCRLADGSDRRATGRCVMGYYDGTEEHYFEGILPGRIAKHPAGDDGFGWDNIFIPDGYEVTRAQLGEADYQKVYARIRPVAELKSFLEKSGH